MKFYKKLPGRKRKFFGYDTLWMGPDHMLLIDSRTYTEEYKRFYFNDIQAIVSSRTGTRGIYNLLFGSIALLFIIPASFSSSDGRIGFWIMGGVFILFLLVNWLMGPTCSSYIKTAVQMEKLSSLNRIRTLRKTMDLLRPEIEAMQGKLSRDDFFANKTVTTIDENSKQLESSPLSFTRENGTSHKILFILMLFSGTICFADIFYNHIVFTIVETLLTIGVFTCVIMSLVKQYRSNMNSSVCILTWAALGYVCIDFVLGYIIYFTLMFNNITNPDIYQNQWVLMKTVSSLSPFDNRLLMGSYIFSVVSSLVLGIPGLYLVSKFQIVNKNNFKNQTRSSISGEAPPSLMVKS